MKFDDFFERRIGKFGKYQYLAVLILGFEELFIALQIMAPNFMAATPKKYWCKHPQLLNDTVFGNCSLEERLRMTVPISDDVMAGNDGLSHCEVFDVEFPPGSCDGSQVRNASIVVDAEELMSNRSVADVGDRMEVNGTGYDVGECEEWVFDNSTFTSTIVTEWQFVCSTARKGKAKSISAIFLAGRCVGNFVFGWLADRFGRRPVFLVGGVLNVILALGAAFVPTYLPFLVIRFAQAVMATGKTNTAFILALEFAPPSKRVTMGTVYFTFWAFGMCVMVGVAYLIRHWRHLLLAITIPEILLYVVFYFTFPESPRWLYTRGRTDEANKTIQHIGRVNGVELPQELDIDTTIEKNKTSPVDLVRTPEIRRVTFIMLFIWAVCGVSYYSFNFGMAELGGDLFLTTLLAGVTELPSALIIILLFTYGGRIPTFTASLLLTSILILSSMAVMGDTRHHWPFVTLTLAGKFTLTVALLMAWIYCGECYPTSIRSMGVTWTAIGARAISPLGPFLVMLGDFSLYLPPILIGLLTLTAGLSVLRLPETRNKPMVETIEAGEAAIRQNKLRLCHKRGKTFINSNSEQHTEDEGVHLDGMSHSDKKGHVCA